MKAIIRGLLYLFFIGLFVAALMPDGRLFASLYTAIFAGYITLIGFGLIATFYTGRDYGDY